MSITGKNTNKGFSLPGAIFVMVVLGGIGVAMVSLNTTTTTTSALNIEQSRAYYSAQSAMELAIAKVIENDKDHSLTNTSCENVDGVNFVLQGFKISISCAATCTDINTNCCTDDPATGNYCSLKPRVSILTVISSKYTMGDSYYVHRQIQATISYDGS